MRLCKGFIIAQVAFEQVVAVERAYLLLHHEGVDAAVDGPV